LTAHLTLRGSEVIDPEAQLRALQSVPYASMGAAIESSGERLDERGNLTGS
jgi:hypothetical protein